MRTRQNLNGTWNFRIDREDIGEKDRWYQHGLQQAMEVEVPHIWQREEAYVQYCGTAWYEKEFTIGDMPAGKRLYLYFGAVDFHAAVWVNGELVGEHEGGFTPFEFDITGLVKTGQNTVSVRVYDPADNAEIPIGKQGTWYTRISGIWQEVYVETRSETFIDHVHVTPDVDQGIAEIAIALSGEYQGMDVQITVTEHLNQDKIYAEFHAQIDGSSQTVSVSLNEVKLWSPENPFLYDMTVTILNGDTVVDTYETYFGMRKVAFADGQIRLNDKPLYVRGALDQAFYPDTIYTAPDDEWIQNEIKLAKQMGFNLLRKHIKIEIPRYLYWADRMGMLIWQEPPNVVKWSNQSNRRFYNELVGMVKRDYNHPSIIIWSLYNEEWGLEWDLANDAEKQKHVINMFEDIKQMDPTRLICDNSGWTHVKTEVNDYHSYFTLPEQFAEWKRELDDYMIQTPEKNFVKGFEPNGEPIIVSEFGVWGLPSIKKLIDYYGKQPSWFENLGDDTHGEDFKKPLTIYDHFERYQLDRVFGDTENLSVHSQRRMYRACQSIIEEMRKRTEINGYVVTEFTDIEWETNGWLDYTRGMKAGFEHAANFNGDLVVMADRVSRNLWSGEAQVWDVIISNHNMKDLSGTLEWEISGTEISGSIAIQEGNSLHVKLDEAIQFTAPAVEKAGFYQLTLSLKLNGEVAAWNEVELTISPREKAASVRVYPYAMDDGFKKKLADNGVRVVDAFEDADVVVTSTLNGEVLNYYRQDGHVLFLAEEGDQLLEKGQFTFRELDRGESWNRTSSFNYVDTEYFPNIPLKKEMGWEFDGLYPDYVIPFSNYNKLGGTIGRVVYMFGNDTIPDTSEIISGYFQGWVGQAGGSMVVQRNAKGSLTLTTWKLIDQYGEHPIATQILHGLIGNATVKSQK